MRLLYTGEAIKIRSRTEQGDTRVSDEVSWVPILVDEREGSVDDLSSLRFRKVLLKEVHEALVDLHGLVLASLAPEQP